MRVNSRISHNRFELTESRISHINACAAQGKSLSATALELCVDPQTVKAAAKRQDMVEWLRGKFPHRSYDCGGGHHNEKSSGEIRNLAPEDISVPLDIDWNSPYVRSAAMVWRGAA
ncbi:hypothetical protein NLU14_08840 [Marinobacter sp. 71-i]|uniref:Uncharacterized protein n=1 Tax=Marinobacter iranensis TaxID=2962607 RepID=A0ABT5Y9H9_9GAMM|nr:hypothetical protein [Marinobacter iranensis]MDF0750336.1 hypothetical protein [Marinobacter iranensis]